MPNPCEYIYESIICIDATAPMQSASLDEYVDILDILSPFSYAIMNEHANASVLATPKLISKMFAYEQVSVTNDYVLGLRSHIGESAEATGLFGQTRTFHIGEAANAASVFTPSVRTRKAIQEVISVVDTTRGGYRQLVAETAAAVDQYLSSRYLVNNVVESITATQAMPNQFVRLTAQAVSEVVAAATVLTHRATQNAAIIERIATIDEYWFRNKDQLAWQMNTETSAVNWHTNYSFDSIAQFGNVVVGASADGVYVLSGDSDADVEIESRIVTGFMDFEDHKVKRLGNVYFGLTGSAAVSLEAFSQAGEYAMPVKTIVSPGSNRVTPGKGLISRYWRVTFTNFEGQDMNIDNIEFDIASSNTRRL